MEDMLSRLKKRRPRFPDDDDCCHGTCRVCVYDDYDIKLERYEETKRVVKSLLLQFEEDE